MFNAAPRRLEEQINKGHFKLAEERRLVAETDRLRRSRRTLKEWQVLLTPPPRGRKYSHLLSYYYTVTQVQREELEGMRGEQKVAREAREHWFRFEDKKLNAVHIPLLIVS